MLFDRLSAWRLGRRLWPLALGLAIGLPVFRFWRSYPWPLALLAAAAVGAFLYASLHTGRRLYTLYNPPDEPER